MAKLLLTALFLTAGPVSAQQLGTPNASILTISSERLFNESAFGRRIAREVEAESAVLVAENRQIEAELSAEEQALTDRRAEMEPEAFRVLADAFDKKVQDIRNTRDARARSLGQKQDAARIDFLNAAAPVLEDLMREAGAGVILERSSVFLSSNATDITDLAIARIDIVLGDGSPSPDDLED